MTVKRIWPSIAVLILTLLSLGTAVLSMQASSEQSPEGNYNPVSLYASEETTAITEDGETAAVKNETVYVILNHDGSVREQSIVNHIYKGLDPEASLVVDYGKYRTVNNMISSIEPLLEDERVIWDSSVFKDEDLYYEGIMDKELPVLLTIEYFLDGEQVKANQLAGKSGLLEIVIHGKNMLSCTEPFYYEDYYGNQVKVEEVNYVPLMVQGSLDVDLNHFSDIDAGEGMSVTSGQTASINFMLFPYPEAETRISMVAEDIELERINMIIIPQLPGFPEVDMEDDLREMAEGLSLIGSGLEDLYYGTSQLLAGLQQFQRESEGLTGGSNEINRLLQDYEAEREKYDNLLSQVNFYEVADYLDEMQTLIDTLEEIPEPGRINSELVEAAERGEELRSSFNLFNRRLSGLRGPEAELKKAASDLINENAPGSELHELGLLILAREEEIEKTISDNRLVEQDLEELFDAMDTAQSSWVQGYAPAMELLNSIEEYRGAAPQELTDLLLTLPEELERYRSYYEEIDQFILEAEEMMTDLSQIPGALDEMVSGQTEIRDGLKELRESGILAIEEGVIEGINESRKGTAQIDFMHELADDYRSHADNERNRHSEVQFILQTGLIVDEKDGSSVDEVEEGEDNRLWPSRLWARLVDLF